ncbi:hypothetical protein C8A00DRAFT_12372 [Chaetomidium leptoderma]|uniref:RRM domain-containing protein n=1 Tax=Chaetomidium leptoderma TaxID=669021 RepID=A0AAN6VV11_9PEZI|nr:hypothetical protein C8A00DRAFT_12372 [Chaetomidium leptoderma]
MHRNQHYNRNLITCTVRPGSETGLYYILVANLAHKTTWKDLKAFASQACEVDHAEVYPPTSGFVRVKGRANFEKAFQYLDGNTLEYRALQADARNMNQSTVVKLLPTDYYAPRILRGDAGRVLGEPTGAGPNDQNDLFAQARMGSPYLDYQGNASPAFHMAPQTDTQWEYITSPSYTAGEGYQPATAHANLTPPGPAYRVAAPYHGFIHQVAAGPHPVMGPSTGYQAATSPTSASSPAAAAQYPYGPPTAYYPGPPYDTGYMQPPTHHAYPAAGYGEPPWPSNTAPPTHPPPAAAHPPYDDDENDNEDNNNKRNHPSATATAAAVATEQRKILIHPLDRDSLSESVVVNLLAQVAGIGTAAGEVERIELRTNRDGRARGTVFVTFASAALAGAAVAALDGREVGGRKLSSRFVVEGVAVVGSSSSLSTTTTTATAGGRSGGGRSGGGRSGGGSQKSKKEAPPVIVDGSGGRWKKEQAPVVVDGSASKKGGGGHRGSRH